MPVGEGFFVNDVDILIGDGVRSPWSAFRINCYLHSTCLFLDVEILVRTLYRTRTPFFPMARPIARLGHI
ncbi:hypothetical protein TWF106_010029 [Orbilia oligospora]|uniref:Uncharacterized protein n=1 Tax=Orbilia oligospora TaxID=2813651 RepID=A0A6G1LXJ3_ORBOL|nr:hypothetical protein TWF788_009648 [Orbilia oligospora]KAF3203179.1 hypothetical protein TWF679_010489 [Orbilia oligospora]KAF3212099.1 hypothetical protein TWF106_010029 [Orbilia oligospora]KAF3231675.1 hypothetical protein TWF191_005735 [Orbilia oligospora]KAF3237612.1 hypothetical protein TWF192_010828 [Orbilia oligospora]